eukprot:306915-Hanusia_phi.AAC.7
MLLPQRSVIVVFFPLRPYTDSSLINFSPFSDPPHFNTGPDYSPVPGTTQPFVAVSVKNGGGGHGRGSFHRSNKGVLLPVFQGMETAEVSGSSSRGGGTQRYRGLRQDTPVVPGGTPSLHDHPSIMILSTKFAPIALPDRPLEGIIICTE